MSNVILTPARSGPTQTAIDVVALLDDLARAYAPIARQRGIKPSVARPVFNGSQTPLLVGTSLEDVLPAFSMLWLKLLYLLPPGSRFEGMSRRVEQDGQTYLRLQITTVRLFMNPNLLVSDTAKILRLENSQPESSVIYVDLLLDAEPEPTRAASLAKEMPEILKSDKMATATKQRIEQFVQDGLSLGKIRASATVQDAQFMETVGQLILANLTNSALDSGVLEREMGLSRAHLFRKLKKLTGFATAKYIRRVRLCTARDLLEATVLPIGEVAGRVGFADLSYFSHAFMEAFGQTPSDWRKQARMKQ